jgi:hypothetical protein
MICDSGKRNEIRKKQGPRRASGCQRLVALRELRLRRDELFDDADWQGAFVQDAVVEFEHIEVLSCC